MSEDPKRLLDDPGAADPDLAARLRSDLRIAKDTPATYDVEGGLAFGWGGTSAGGAASGDQARCARRVREGDEPAVGVLGHHPGGAQLGAGAGQRDGTELILNIGSIADTGVEVMHVVTLLLRWKSNAGPTARKAQWGRQASEAKG